MGKQICHDSKTCFAQSKPNPKTKVRTCSLLHTTYEKDGACPFCKPVADVTNGIKYPYNPDYAK